MYMGGIRVNKDVYLGFDFSHSSRGGASKGG